MPLKIRDLVFEFEDQSWFPGLIRKCMTDYLRYVLSMLNAYEPITPLLAEGLHMTAAGGIVDLCSGGGGCIEQIRTSLQNRLNQEVCIRLTDKFPNTEAFRFLSEKTNGGISYSVVAVDAANVPNNLKGFRTIFSGFHHFNLSCAKSVIRNAVEAKTGIGIFDCGDKSIFMVLAITLFHPIAFFILTPFFRPFRLSRIIFTYLIPIIPLCTMWDGIASIIRLYHPHELLAIAKQVDDTNYTWKAGKMRNKMGLAVAYLVGYPK